MRSKLQGHPRETNVHSELDSENPPSLTERLLGSEGKSRTPWLIGLLAIALYVGTLGYEFVWDDLALIVLNQHIRRLADLPTWLSMTADQLSFGAFSGNLYRPGVMISFAVDFAIWGNNPVGFHLTNVLLHGIMVSLVYHLVRAILTREDLAIAAALLFAVHPTHVEAVTWIAARADLWVSVWMTMAMLLYHASLRTQGYRRAGLYAGALATMTAGLAFKEAAVVLPAMFLLLECLGPRINASRGTASLCALARTVPFWIMAVAHLVFLSRPLQAYNNAPFSPEVLLHRLPGSLEIFARYLCLLLFPVNMKPFYDLHRVGSFLEPWPMLGGMLFVGIVLLGLVSWRHLPGASFGVGWYLLSIAPFLDLMAFSPRQMGLADRYLYGPSVGIVILSVVLLDRAVSRLAGRYGKGYRLLFLGMTTGVLVLICTAVTAQYMRVWKNNVTLYSRMIEDFPASAGPHGNLGLTYLDLAELDQGIAELETAQRLNPRWARPQIPLALAYVTTGNPAAGFQLFDKIAPAAAQNHEYYALRGQAHLLVHEPKAAIGVARAGLQRFPTSLRLHFLLARAQEEDGDLNEAARTFRQVLLLEPNLAPAYEGLGRIFASQGEYGAAALALQRCREIEPDRLSAIRLFAQVREREGRVQDSLDLWREVATLTQDPSDRAETERLVRRLQEAFGVKGP